MADSTIQITEGSGKYLKEKGAGTSGDPAVPYIAVVDGDNVSLGAKADAAPATSSLEDTTAHSLIAILKKVSNQIGEVAASPTSNTLLERLKALGNVIVSGTVGIDQSTANANEVVIKGGRVRVYKEITRPSNTTAYAAKDAIADASASSTTQKLTNCARVNGGSGAIVRAVLKTDKVDWTNPVYVVIYDAAPPAAFIADNAAFDVLYAEALSQVCGIIRFTNFETITGGTGAQAWTVAEGLYIPFKCAVDSRDLYFQKYIPGGSPTPASAQKFVLILGIEQD